jgi:hypothetical protein
MAGVYPYPHIALSLNIVFRSTPDIAYIIGSNRTVGNVR